MGLEVATDIEGLDNTWPLSGDGATDGAAHIKLVKSVLKGIFQGAGGQGFNVVINSDEAEWNFCQGITSNVQQQINTLNLSSTPISSIHMWSTANPIPTGWVICDGANGTPNLIDQFIRCTAIQAELRLSGGFSEQITASHSHTQSHTHAATAETKPDHTHDVDNIHTSETRIADSSSDTFFGTSDNAPMTSDNAISVDHFHYLTLDDYTGNVSNAGLPTATSDTNLPSFTTLIYIKRVS